MKILIASFLNEIERGGGATIVVNNLIQSLIHQGFEVVLISTWNGREIKNEFGNNYKKIKIPAMNLYWIGDKDVQSVTRRIIWQVVDIWNPLIYRIVRDICIEEKPDIFHSHKLRGLSPSIWSAANTAGVKKIIHTCHDFELLSPQGLFMGWVGRLAKEQHFFLKPYQLIRRNLSEQVNVATSPSSFSMSFHQQMGFFPKARIEIIPNTHGQSESGLVRNKEEKPRFIQNNDTLNLLYIGRMEEEKGVIILCEAIKQLRNEGLDIVLRVAGAGKLETILREKYCDEKNLQFLGLINFEKKKEVFLKTQVLVAPSLVAETFGIVIAEAYSYGIPVIASNLGAFPEIVKEGETGFLVEPGSKENLMQAVKVFHRKKSLIDKMQVNCFEEAKKYTIDRFAKNYQKLY